MRFHFWVCKDLLPGNIWPIGPVLEGLGSAAPATMAGLSARSARTTWLHAMQRERCLTIRASRRRLAARSHSGTGQP